MKTLLEQAKEQVENERKFYHMNRLSKTFHDLVENDLKEFGYSYSESLNSHFSYKIRSHPVSSPYIYVYVNRHEDSKFFVEVQVEGVIIYSTIQDVSEGRLDSMMSSIKRQIVLKMQQDIKNGKNII